MDKDVIRRLRVVGHGLDKAKALAVGKPFDCSGDLGLRHVVRSFLLFVRSYDNRTSHSAGFGGCLVLGL